MRREHARLKTTKVDQTRALLDSLMGKDRDVEASLKVERKWKDPDICEWFLCGFCPNELFVNTRSDLGPCEKDHDPKMVEKFRDEDTRDQNRVERRFVRHLESLLMGVDNRIRRGNERLNLVAEDAGGPFALELARKTEQIREMQTQMETLGEEGKIDEVEELMKQSEILKEEQAALELKNKTKDDKEGAMTMCEICGIWKSDNPEDPRAKNHFSGKQHLGYEKIRNALTELTERLKFAPPESTEERRKDREKRTDREDGEADDKSRDRDRDRDRGRDRRDGDRDRDRGRRDSGRRDRRDKSRSRDRGRRDRRDRSRSRDRGRRDRDRGRDRDRDRRSRRDDDDRDKKRRRSRSKSGSPEKEKEEKEKSRSKSPSKEKEEKEGDKEKSRSRSRSRS